MAERAIERMTVEEFLAWQQDQEDRYELVEGVPVKMMSGASNFHDVIAVNLITRLHDQLRGTRCRVATADTAVRTATKGVRRPDVTVTCEPPRADSYEADDPKLVVEILSESNTGIDWQRKLEEYRRREGLIHVLLVDSAVVATTLLTRSPAGWTSRNFDRRDEVIELPEIGCPLAVAQIYEGLELPNVPAPAE